MLEGIIAWFQRAERNHRSHKHTYTHTRRGGNKVKMWSLVKRFCWDWLAALSPTSDSKAEAIPPSPAPFPHLS